MKQTVHCSYRWERVDGCYIPNEHLEQLEVMAREQIKQLAITGYSGCPLHAKIKHGDNEIEYKGYLHDSSSRFK